MFLFGFCVLFPVLLGGGFRRVLLHTVDLLFGQFSVNLPGEISDKSHRRPKENLQIIISTCFSCSSRSINRSNFLTKVTGRSKTTYEFLFRPVFPAILGQFNGRIFRQKSAKTVRKLINYSFDLFFLQFSVTLPGKFSDKSRRKVRVLPPRCMFVSL